MAQTPFEIEFDDITLARARRGHLPSCELIFRAFQQPAYSVAFRICQCPDTAQEVLQEAFITAFRKLRQFRGDAPLWGWLRRVVINHAISAMRRDPRSAEIPLEEDRATVASADERIGLALDLESALAALDDQDRAVVWLHDVEGYAHQEIADMFGKTESFSKTRLSRARARLRSLLGTSSADGAGPAADHRAAGGSRL